MTRICSLILGGLDYPIEPCKVSNSEHITAQRLNGLRKSSNPARLPSNYIAGDRS